MISIEAWRCSIGCHNILSGHHTFKEDRKVSDANATQITFLRSSMGSLLRPANLLAILLLIGCVESNPGPNHGEAEGKCAIQLT